LHDRFEAHLDRFSQAGAVVLNLPLQTVHSFRQGVAKLADPDLIVTAAERSLLEATSLLLSNIEGAEPECSDWPDGLAAALMEDSSLVLSAWAEEQGLEPWMLSRGFQQVFGISAEAFRARTRARRAWKAILCTKTPLAEIAVDLGFSDQAHMTRSVKQLSGLVPGAWRGCKWIQDNVTSGR
jgi:AraC-like DNA-binding protein